MEALVRKKAYFRVKFKQDLTFTRYGVQVCSSGRRACVLPAVDPLKKSATSCAVPVAALRYSRSVVGPSYLSRYILLALRER